MQVLVGGGAADVADVVARVGADFPRTGLFIAIATYLVLFVLLRSVILPAKALVMNTLSIVASFGALVWIFQDGNLSALLGFQPLGFVETTQPVILFCVLFGLSMDYEVFILSRTKEVWDRTGDNPEAVARGLERSGRIVTSAALVVVVVAGSFAFADIVLIKALGVGMAIAIAIDATVVRALLVPGHDAAPRTLELVDACGTRAVRQRPGCRRPRPRSRRRSDDGTTCPDEPARVRCGCAPGRCRRWPAPARPAADRSWPIRRRRGRRSRPRPSARTSPPTRSRSSCPATTDRTTDSPNGGTTRAISRRDDGRRFGFEDVIFRAERGAFPTSWVSHLAITDEDAGRFLVQPATRDRATGRPLAAQRRDGTPTGFDLSVAADPTDSPGAGSMPAWSMSGSGGADHLSADAHGRPKRRTAGSPKGLGLDLGIEATKPPALHGEDGWVDFGPAGGSYYYSTDVDDRDRDVDDRRHGHPPSTVRPGSITSGATSSRSVAAAGTGSRSTSTMARTSRCRSCAMPTAAIR